MVCVIYVVEKILFIILLFSLVNLKYGKLPEVLASVNVFMLCSMSIFVTVLCCNLGFQNNFS